MDTNDDYDEWYYNVMGGVPWDHWGRGCTDACNIPQHIAYKEGLARRPDKPIEITLTLSDEQREMLREEMASAARILIRGE